MVPTRPGPASPSGNKGDEKKPRSPSKKPKKKPKGAADKEEQAKKKAEKKVSLLPFLHQLSLSFSVRACLSLSFLFFLFFLSSTAHAKVCR